MDDDSGDYSGIENGACATSPSATMIAMMSLSLGENAPTGTTPIHNTELWTGPESHHHRIQIQPPRSSLLTRPSAALTFASFVKTLATKPHRSLPPYDTFMSTADDRLETRA